MTTLKPNMSSFKNINHNNNLDNKIQNSQHFKFQNHSSSEQAVECAFPYHLPAGAVAARVAETGLEQVLLNTDPGDCKGYGARKGDEEKFMASLTRSLEYCVALGARKLHIMAGSKVEGVGQEEANEIFIGNLRKAMPLLAKAGVVGLVEPINQWSVPNYNMDSYTAGLHIVR